MADMRELADHAKAMLQDQATQEALRVLRVRHTNAWINTKPEQTAEREQAWYAFRAVLDLEASLKSLEDAPKVHAFNARPRTAGA